MAKRDCSYSSDAERMDGWESARQVRAHAKRLSASVICTQDRELTVKLPDGTIFEVKTANGTMDGLWEQVEAFLAPLVPPPVVKVTRGKSVPPVVTGPSLEDLLLASLVREA